uniref:glucuronosyltransferase n=1 Tax=Plectus sambesii TaxID=2011161 RepID=A0A914VUW0_9BILA
MFSGKIADALLDAGHEVVVYMPLMDPDVKSNGTSRARIIRYQPLANENTWYSVSFKKDPFDDGTDIMTDENIETFQQIMDDVCEGQISNKQLLQQLREENFDLAMGEMFDYCAFGLFEVLNIPARILTSAVPFGEGHAMLLGVPAPPSYVPSLLSGMTDDMSYSERMINLYIRYMIYKWVAKGLPRQNALFRRYFGDDFPCLMSLAHKSSLMLVNGEEMFELARPISHKVIYISGIGVPEPKPLDEKLENIIAKGEKGAVYLSFGSLANCSRFPLEKKLAILEAFASFPEYQFIWKYEQPENDWQLFENYTNIHPVKWAPQVDLL